MFSKIKSDLSASIVVFLVALPLCLGIALASGAPLLSGLIAGIIGGIIVGVISQSPTSVSGPAAGLSAIVLAAITQLGSFNIFLLAVCIAGFIQLAVGLAKGGFLANFIPSNVIKGLLASIGIILILKQIPYALGYEKSTDFSFSFFHLNGENTFSALSTLLSSMSIAAVILSAFSIICLIYWDKFPWGKNKFFPSSLFVVLFGVFANFLFVKYFPSIAISDQHLVSIPKIENWNSIFTFPDFASFGNVLVWKVGFTLAIVASIETLLNLEAIENLDPHKRIASPNRELVAQGIGNMVSGLVGGIPITSVIVRGSVNINAGAASKWSTIFHAVFLLISVFLISPFLNLIPLASLACILLVTGYKLAKVSLFKQMFDKGWNQFIPFLTTILAIVFTDLLKGVLIGLAISIFYILKSNLRNAFQYHSEIKIDGEHIKIRLAEELSFLNKASIKKLLAEVPANAKVQIDASNSVFIDQDILELINDFETITAVDKNIHLEKKGF